MQSEYQIFLRGLFHSYLNERVIQGRIESKTANRGKKDNKLTLTVLWNINSLRKTLSIIASERDVRAKVGQRKGIGAEGRKYRLYCQ